MPPAINFVNGQATISGSSNGVMTLYKAGSTTITVTDGGSYNNGAGTTVTVNPAGAGSLVIVQQPSSVFAGATMSPSVTVQVDDVFGNTVSDNGLPVTLSTSANTIASGATASTNSSGLATFSAITINTGAVNLTLTASAAGLSTSSPSSSFNVTVLVNNGDTFTDTASDAGSGVKSVTYYYCAGLSGSCTSGSGTQIGSPAMASPYSVAWNSQPTDGDYQVVAVGTDNVTNMSSPSTSIPVTVDNTSPTVSISSPVNGTAYTSSTWPGSITGTASDPTSGIVSTAVAIEDTTSARWWNGSSFSATGQTFVSTTYSSPSWSYALAATNLTAGHSYTVVGRATDTAGNIGTSATVNFSRATFSETDLKDGSCGSLTSGSCSTSSFSTTNGDTDLVLVNVVTSGSSSTAAISSISGPFGSASLIATEQYPSAGNENYLFAYQATGNGTSAATSVAFTNVSNTGLGTAYIQVVQLGAGDTVVTSSSNGGTPTGNGSTFAMTITPSSSSDSEIAMVGTSSSDTFSTPAGWTDISGTHVADWDSFSDATIQASTTVSMSSTRDNWGYIAIEINP